MIRTIGFYLLARRLRTFRTEASVSTSRPCNGGDSDADRANGHPTSRGYPTSQSSQRSTEQAGSATGELAVVSAAPLARGMWNPR